MHLLVLCLQWNIISGYHGRWVLLPGFALSYFWICRLAVWLKKSLIKNMFLENFSKLRKQRWPGGMVRQCWSCVDCVGKALPLSLKIQQFTRPESCPVTVPTLIFGVGFFKTHVLCGSILFVCNQTTNVLWVTFMSD